VSQCQGVTSVPIHRQKTFHQQVSDLRSPRETDFDYVVVTTLKARTLRVEMKLRMAVAMSRFDKTGIFVWRVLNPHLPKEQLSNMFWCQLIMTP
jgi:hypothetical protein